MMKVFNKITGAVTVAIYATNPQGNKRFNVDGIFLSDKKFNANFLPAHDDYCNNREHKKLIDASDSPRCLSCGRKVSL